MKSILGIYVTGILMMGCEPKSDSLSQVEKRVEFNQDLADELKRMAEIEQIDDRDAF